MDAISRRLENQYANDNKDTGVRITPLHEDAVGRLRPVLLLLFAAVGFLLFIGCANVANLLLARAATRSREISIRAAMGASRFRLIRQLLTESVILSIIGGAIGALLAAWAIPLLMSMAPPGLQNFKEVGLNREVLAFSLGVSVITGILFGLVPALSSASGNPAEALKQILADSGLTYRVTSPGKVVLQRHAPNEIDLTLVGFSWIAAKPQRYRRC